MTDAGQFRIVENLGFQATLYRHQGAIVGFRVWLGELVLNLSLVSPSSELCNTFLVTLLQFLFSLLSVMMLGRMAFEGVSGWRGDGGAGKA